MRKYVLLVGGGKVGYYLARTLVESGYYVGLVEIDQAVADRAASDLGITVVCGDATEPDILLDADAAEASYVLALTGSDEINLAICQLAKASFGVAEVVARVINPKNEAIMKRLGIDATISTTALAAQTIEKVLPARGMRLSSIFSEGDLEMAELVLEANSPVVGLAVASVSLPEESLLIALQRADGTFIPRGKTVFLAGDRVFALARMASLPGLRLALLGGRL